MCSLFGFHGAEGYPFDVVGTPWRRTYRHRYRRIDSPIHGDSDVSNTAETPTQTASIESAPDELIQAARVRLIDRGGHLSLDEVRALSGLPTSKLGELMELAHEVRLAR